MIANEFYSPESGEDVGLIVWVGLPPDRMTPGEARDMASRLMDMADFAEESKREHDDEHRV